MKKYDYLTMIGLSGGLVLTAVGIIIAGGLAGAKTFISVSSFITVVGGLIASLMVNFSVKELKETIKSVKRAFFEDEQDVGVIVDQFIELSTTARREGLLALDNKIDQIDDPFIKKGILLTIDGLEADVIKEILNAEIVALEEKQNIGKNVFEKAGELAPAWGMIGTLMGLVLMLRNLSDADAIGPAMALALITTFYGAVLANLFFIPLSGKLGNRTENEVYIKQIMIEGVLGVQSGQNPKLLREKLDVFVTKKPEEKGKQATLNEEVAY